MRVALINTNRMQPPIAPLALDYIAEAVHAAGHPVAILDLCWDEDWRAAVSRFFSREPYGLVGLSLRNTDDCAFSSQDSFVPGFAEVVRAVRQATDGLVVAGGVGFSIMPEPILAACPADAGVWGEGEFAMVELADRLAAGQDWRDLPGLVVPRDGQWCRNPVADRSLAELPAMTRRWLDQRRYFREGGQLGFETKRGCALACVYCADPVAKGNRVRPRPPAAVGAELQQLLAQGCDCLHTCDSEFNLPLDHARAVCAELSRRGLGDRLRWYAYCAPVPFPEDFAHELRRAGCVGVNFGTDSGDDGMLRRLGRGYTAADVRQTVHACRAAGLTVMLDLLLGAPGETRASLQRTVELTQALSPDRVGVTVGVRVYPGTRLAANRDELRAGLELHGQGAWALEFYLEPAVAPFVFTFLDELIGADERFLFFSPHRPERNYNYNANERLSAAIRAGHRGAYWDILRRYRQVGSAASAAAARCG